MKDEIEEVKDTDITVLDKKEQALVDQFFKGKNRKYARFILAALGSIPWVGGVLGGIAALDAENEQGKINELQRLWLQEHKEKIKELGVTIEEILTRLDGFGEEVKNRMESEEYLTLVRRSFTAWDQADTQDKRNMFKRLLTNAAAITLCPDDLIRLFISWIEKYHEAHFVVIKEIYQNPSITRGEIWDHIHPEGRPVDSSADAGLFAYLIRDLSTGGVVHQEKEITYDGSYRKPPRPLHRSTQSSDTYGSPFEDTKPYVLTELGKEFVRYVMEDVVPQITSGDTL